MSVVLALDLAGTTGFAAQKADGSIVSGRVKLEATKEPTGKRLNAFRRWLTDQKASLGGDVDFVVWEQPVVRNANAVAPLFQLIAAVTMWADHHQIGYANAGVAIATIKKFATGAGNAGKRQMIDAARELGFDVADDNEADAIHLLRLTLDKNPHLKAGARQCKANRPDIRGSAV